MSEFNEDNYENDATPSAILMSSGAVINAIDEVCASDENEKIKYAFCNIRPPGHHSKGENGDAAGFCFVNNVAIGALYALK